MAVIWIEGVPHRKRRGKIVPIPEQWFGHTTAARTIRHRNSHTREKQIENQQRRARAKAALRSEEDPADPPPLFRIRWRGESGQIDPNRDKFRRERKKSHPSRDPSIAAPK